MKLLFSQSPKRKFLYGLITLIASGLLIGGLNASLENNLVGELPEQFRVNSEGAAVYNLNIDVPPGTAGLVPAVSLNFNSQGSIGHLGFGWSLAGISRITRCPQNIFPDGVVRNIKFDSEDKFCLDGQRLTAISGQYGADGTEYRTVKEGFAKIVSYGQAGSGPEYFQVHLKGGSIQYFGGSEDSRLEAPDRTEVAEWSISKTSDRSGNYITYHYSKNKAESEHYISSIEYTGSQSHTPYNKISFTYGERNVAYRISSGLRRRFSKTLETITTLAHGEKVKEYRLNYTFNSFYETYRLGGVRVCDKNGDCLRGKTWFSWSTAEFKEPASSKIPIPNGWSFKGLQPITGDFNGDGLTDYIELDDKRYFTFINKGDGTYSSSKANHPDNWGLKTTKAITGDFNGNGVTDFIRVGKYNLHIFLNDGKGTFTATRTRFPNNWNYNNIRLTTGDFNGDGLIDFIQMGHTAYHQYTSNGDGTFSATRLVYPNSWKLENTKVITGDYNGDGLTDFMHIGKYNYHPFLNKGDGTFSATRTRFPNNWTFNNKKLIGGDFNGDGLSDFLIAHDKTYFPFFNNGDGTYSVSRRIFPNNWDFKNHKLVPGDFNGDGKTEFAMLGHRTYITFFHNGDGSYVGRRYIFPNNWNFKDSTPITGDFNGDGLTDFLELGHVNYYPFINNTNPRSTLSYIQTGFGKTTAIYYKPLSNPDAHTKSDSVASFPVSNIPSGRYVVTKVATSNGANGRHGISYKYYGSKTHRQGRGSLGFSQIDIRDDETGFIKQTMYSQDYGKYMVGSVVTSKTVNDSGMLLDYTENTYETRKLEPGSRYFSFIKRSVSKKKSLDGVLLSTKISEANYANDPYGNLLGSSSLLSGAGDSLTETTLNSYLPADETSWQIARVDRITKTAKFNSNPEISKTTLLTNYHPTLGIPTVKIVHPGTTNELKQKTTFNQFGQALEVSVSSPGVASRTNTIEYDARGQFPISKTDALGHKTKFTYESKYGNLVRIESPGGQVSTRSYNTLGNLHRSVSFDGRITTSKAYFCYGSSRCSGREYYYTEAQTEPHQPTYAYFDSHGRVIRTETSDLNGKTIYSKTAYDRMGRLYKSTLPFFEGEREYYKQYHFDKLGRVRRTRYPNGSPSHTSYEGSSATTTRAHNRNQYTKQNVAGWLTHSSRNSNSVSYKYNSLGLPYETSSNGNKVLMEYDALGRKTSITDPNQGPVSFTYNAFGDIITRKDAKGQITCMAYDQLGRLTDRIDNYQGDSAADNCRGDGANPTRIKVEYHQSGPAAGKIQVVNRIGDSYKKIFEYDDQARPKKITEKITGQYYSTYFNYDELSRLTSKRFSDDVTLTYKYNAAGYRNQVFLDRRHNEQKLLWTAGSANAAGTLESFMLGNGVETTRDHDAATGFLKDIRSSRDSLILQDEHYVQNYEGNLLFRQDLVSGYGERFSFDFQNRLTRVQPYADEELKNNRYDQTEVNSLPGLQADNIVTLQYSPSGNITHKSDVGDYTYEKGPHAVTGISGVISANYEYDANGNMIHGGQRSIKYTSFNKPSEIQANSNQVNIYYGANRLRIQRVDSKNDQVHSLTTYVGKTYEKVEKNGFTLHRYYLGDFAVMTRQEGLPDQLHYLHKDNLGSLVALTNESGEVVERFSYDVWGKRRPLAVLNPAQNFAANLLIPETQRGYTGHEHLDPVSLIHMNGRVYDPVIARFLSPDPYIQAPDLSQSFNRYSYVLNNPLRYTDPSGYFFKKIGRAFKKVGKAIGKGTLKVISSQAFAIAVAVIEITGGLALCVGSGGAACAAGAFAVVHGVDSLQAAIRGESSFAVQGLVAAGLSEEVAVWVDIGISLGVGVGGSAAAAAKSARAARATRAARGARAGRAARTASVADDASLAAQFQRELKAATFYRANGFDGPGGIKAAKSHVGGIDLTKNVDIVTLSKADGSLSQWQKVGQGRGNYFTRPGVKPAKLGINPKGRVETRFIPDGDVSALRSTAKSIVDTWTDPGVAFKAEGGGLQYFTGAKDAFTAP